MAIDYWQLTKDFKVGDTVQKFMPGKSALTPFLGRVTAVLPGIGFVDVQWPFSNERVSPEELVRVDPSIGRLVPPSLNTSYAGLDGGPKVATYKGKTLWRFDVPVGFHLDLARLFYKGASDVQAYDALWHQYRQVEDGVIRGEVAKFYGAAHNLVTAFLSEYATKTAAYWADRDRKYRATKTELEARSPNCPKCKAGPMRKTTYKMEGGKRARLFACPSCLYLVKPSDILGPAGPVEW